MAVDIRGWFDQYSSLPPDTSPRFQVGDHVLITDQMPLDSGSPLCTLHKTSLGKRGTISEVGVKSFSGRMIYRVKIDGLGYSATVYNEWIVRVS